MNNNFQDYRKLIEFLKSKGDFNQELLDAMYNTPRVDYVDEAFSHLVNFNDALPIGYGQTISQPYIVLRMLQLLDLNEKNIVLEIGTGSGFQTSVLSKLVSHVYSIERIKALQLNAKRVMRLHNITNVTCKHSDGFYGWESKAPYDAIIFSAAISEKPLHLIKQLKLNGKLIAPIGDKKQKLIMYIKKNGSVTEKVFENVNFVPLLTGLC